MFRRLARGESAFFLHKHYNGCVPRMSARNTLGAGNELEPAYNAGLTDKGHFLGLERIQYDMPNKIQFCVDKEGLPVGCAENSGLTSEAQDKEKQGGGFNGEYVGADGKIDKAKLFGYILQGGSLAWNDLRTKLMQTAHIRSVHFAETLMQEARDGGLMQTLLINGRREYLLQRQQKLFDEDT